MNAPACDQSSSTAQQLAVKNVDRIEAINAPGGDKRCEAALYTWEYSRIMRRDFNITSIKLFFFCKQTDQADLARHLLWNLTEEANLLEYMAAPYEMPDGPVYNRCVMRILTEETQRLFDALVTADRAFHKLKNSAMGEVAEDNLIPFMRAYNALRQRVIGYAKRQPAESE
jgi:hypothetical protein